ncbi:SPRY domain-containing SOCS box protein 3-like [Prorops nasuta]|uniref:SPRY domain-containing SOCS box protein 3-like n=1 Tax=Prorops nasuta TaxID=863751 RepID=UPI0034CF1B30
MTLDYFPNKSSKYSKFCKCEEDDCLCGESNEHEWIWDTNFVCNSIELSKHNLEVKFHPGFSSGTAAIRGNTPMEGGKHHFWEVKMLTGIYGTDVMIGVGTKDADLIGARENYCSLLGKDQQSWGFSYKGYIQHGGEKRDYALANKQICFKSGNLVGVHVDTWKGTIEFYLDRTPLGVAFTGLRDIPLYPMVCSTAAKCKMRITCSSSMPSSLQMDCLAKLTFAQKAYLRNTFPGLHYLSESIFANILQTDDDNSSDYDDDELLASINHL